MKRRAKASARSASGPSADQPAAGRASSKVPGSWTIMPTLPKRRAGSTARLMRFGQYSFVPKLIRPKCNRLGARMAKTLLLILNRSFPPDPFHVVAQKSKSLLFLFSSRLFHEHGQLAEFRVDLIERQEVRPRGEDRGLEDGMFGP